MTIAKKECEYPQLGKISLRTSGTQRNLSDSYAPAAFQPGACNQPGQIWLLGEGREHHSPHLRCSNQQNPGHPNSKLLYYWHRARHTVFYTDRIKRLTSMSDTIAEMDTPEQEILSYIFHEWEGSLKALVHWVGMYVSITSKTLRVGLGQAPD